MGILRNAPVSAGAPAERRHLSRSGPLSSIGKGGGTVDRSAKAIPLSPEMRALLNLQGERASGEEVIRRILIASVDLLYNGGIGTHIKPQAKETLK